MVALTDSIDDHMSCIDGHLPRSRGGRICLLITASHYEYVATRVLECGMWGVPEFKFALSIPHKTIRAAGSQPCKIARVVVNMSWSVRLPVVPGANGR